MREWTQDEIDDDMSRFEDDEPELVIVCPDDMCRGQWDGEAPPCGRWQPSCVRYIDRNGRCLPAEDGEREDG